MKNLIGLCTFIFLLMSCSNEEHRQKNDLAVRTALASNDQFNDYWFSGEAEINSYELIQARYGELHRGEAALVFVTEPFSKSKLVKLDNPSEAGSDKQDVLKLNMTKKFYTGIYPYSMMMSTFTPVDHSKAQRPLKISTTSQEWCGHTFTQYNKEGKNYEINQYSYFESEGDIKTKVPSLYTEDEIWTQIRLNPKELPIGQFKMIPGSFFTRLKHTSFEPVEVSAKIEKSESGAMIYSVDYANRRNLKINFSSEFPFEINSWTETLTSGFGSSAKQLTTTARLKKRIKLDYWTRNGVADGIYREELGMVGY